MTLAEWLTAQDYRPTTIRDTLRQLDLAYVMESLPEYMTPALRRYLAWVKDVGEETAMATVADPSFYHRLLDAGLEPSRGHGKRPKRRKTERRSFDDEAWHQLVTAIRADGSDEGLVLSCLLSGLRVSDILPLTVSQLDVAVRSGIAPLERKGGVKVTVPTAGNEQAWQRLYDAVRSDGEAATVAELLTRKQGASAMAGDAAYQRLRRRLKATGDSLGLQGPIHLHRMRRTRAVQGLRVTKDITQVKQLLGHRSATSTMQYLDETRSDDVARLQRKLAKFDKPRED